MHYRKTLHETTKLPWNHNSQISLCLFGNKRRAKNQWWVGLEVSLVKSFLLITGINYRVQVSPTPQRLFKGPHPSLLSISAQVGQVCRYFLVKSCLLHLMAMQISTSDLTVISTAKRCSQNSPTQRFPSNPIPIHTQSTYSSGAFLPLYIRL